MFDFDPIILIFIFIFR